MVTRINLSFTDTNENQRKALEILQQHKHNKTQFISDCIVYYLTHNANNVTKSDIRQMVMEVLGELSLPTQTLSVPQAQPEPQPQPVAQPKTTSEPPAKEEPQNDTKPRDINETINGLNDEAMQNLLGDLALFDSM